MRVKCSREGVTFPYHGDILTFKWSWIFSDKFNKYWKFYSKNYDIYSSSLRDYWLKVGKMSALEDRDIGKVSGFYTQEIIEKWVETTLRFGYYVVLHDIYLGAKSSELWNKLTDYEKVELKKDVVVLKCKDLREVEKICDSISLDFAHAIGVSSGTVIYWNENIRRPDDIPPIRFTEKRL